MKHTKQCPIRSSERHVYVSNRVLQNTEPSKVFSHPKTFSQGTQVVALEMCLRNIWSLGWKGFAFIHGLFNAGSIILRCCRRSGARWSLRAWSSTRAQTFAEVVCCQPIQLVSVHFPLAFVCIAYNDNELGLA